MDLQNFIKQTLVSIKTGVAGANKDLGAEKGKPVYAIYSRNDGEVVFDVAVTVSAETKKNKQGSLKVAVVGVGFGAGADKKDTDAQQTVSRIKFSVKVDSTIR
jgi:hypothetical protein